MLGLPYNDILKIYNACVYPISPGARLLWNYYMCAYVHI